ncbi:MAG: CO dehydrogenase/acetyl-CoA synthase complex subunit alpha [Promethearchaeota archaeon]
MSNKARIKIDKYSGILGDFSGLEINIGKVSRAEDEEWEQMGPTPKPQIPDLRHWFMEMMERYPPFYSPICEKCCLCTFGPCLLAEGRHGACGITLEAQQARIVEAACCIGAACHSSHGLHLLHHCLEKFGDLPIDLGSDIQVEAPLTRLICGIRPQKLSDFEEAFDWIGETLTHLLSAAHTGQEASALDYEVKSFTAGLMDSVGMEASDIVQIVGFGMPKGDPETPLVDCGMGTLDRSKACILMIGHNVAPGIGLVEYLRENNLTDEVEVGAICCTAHDMTRYYESARVVGTISKQLRYVRSGIPDVIMIDEQCINLRIFDEAQKIKAPFIATNEKNMMGLPDRSKDDIQAIVEDLATYKVPGVLLLDPDKAGAVAVEVARRVKGTRKDNRTLPTDDEIVEQANKCIGCGNCKRSCPNDLPLPEAIAKAKDRDFSLLEYCFDICIGCTRCEDDCHFGVSPHDLIAAASRKIIATESYKMRSGRGPVTDVEIRNVGAPIVLGEIPGIIAIVGCANYHAEFNEVAVIAEEFLKRGYIVAVSGCGAMDIALYKTEEGKSLYEVYDGNFDRGCLVNVGSCVSNAHITGTVAKVANIFARRPLRGNFEEISDYALHRIGACGLAWGAMSQKAASIASSVNGIGVPVVVGPHSSEYRRMYLGREDKPEVWKAFNARDGTAGHEIPPVPENLLVCCENKEECIVSLAKLCIRAADSTKGRNIKLSHWIDLSMKYFGKFPDAKELAKYIRIDADIPINLKDEILKKIKAVGWEPKEIIDPTLVERTCRKN